MRMRWKGSSAAASGSGGELRSHHVPGAAADAAVDEHAEEVEAAIHRCP